MKHCYRIVFVVTGKKKDFHEYVKKCAKKHNLEGMMQLTSETELKVVACGGKEKLENFIDQLHKGIAQKELEGIEIEPFFNTRDYRGVFRIIE